MEMRRMEDIHLRDPFILAVEDCYYLYGTRCGSQNAGFDGYTSTDLQWWTGPVPVFERPDHFWADRDFWAPEVHRYRDRYYMFATFKSEKHCRGTQILWADSPLGPFLPLTDGPVTPADWECLDGTLFLENGRPYLVFCHEWLQVQDGEMCAMELTPDLRSAAGSPKVLFRASEPAWASKGRDFYVTDGPFLYRKTDGTLLMLWSSGTETGYSEAISRSASGSVLGPWIHEPELLISNGGGHGMVFRSFDNQRFFVCHKPNRDPLERPHLFPLLEPAGNCGCSLRLDLT